MNSLQVTILAGEFGFCEICSNPTPRVRVIEDGFAEDGCQYCFEAYGEINQPQCQWSLLSYKYQKKG